MPSFKWVRASAPWLLIACNTPASPPTLVDGPPEDTPPAATNTVFVELYDSAPTFIRYRTGDGDWQEPVDVGDGYELTVGADYELVAACATDTAADVGF